MRPILPQNQKRETSVNIISASAFMLKQWAGFLILSFLMTGCAVFSYDWTVRTTSTQFSHSMDLAGIGREKIALFTPLTMPVLRGNEAGLNQHLAEVIMKTIPAWNIIDEHQTLNLINLNGLAEDYRRLRENAELSPILEREILHKIGNSIGARFVLQPRLAYLSQTMTDRWTVPFFAINLLQTRSSNIRVSLQLWDTENGELLWFSTAEASLQSEAIDQKPVFLEDAVRVTFGSMLMDLLNGETSSKYTPLREVLHNLIQEESGSEQKKQSRIQNDEATGK